MATSRRHPRRGTGGSAGSPPAAGAAGAATGAMRTGAAPAGQDGDELPMLPPVRLAPRDELAAAARVAPLLRAAREVARWAGEGRPAGAGNRLPPGEAQAAMAELELTPAELDAAWRVAAGTRMLRVIGGRTGPGENANVLAEGTTDEVLATWDGALGLMLDAEDLDGMATALYTVGGPVKMDALFEAYLAAAGARDREGSQAAAGPDRTQLPRGDTVPSRAQAPGPLGPQPPAVPQGAGPPQPPAVPPRGGDPLRPPVVDHAAELSGALEALADLGVVELGTDESGGGLTVALSRLGVWGVHRRLRTQGWHVPVLASAARGGATALLATLASCDIEDGEAEIAAWLDAREPARAAAELIDAARRGTPGLRGASFAVLDRIGADAVPPVRAALSDPVLRPHAAVWLHEHGEEADLGPGDRAWLLVDLGAGLLEEADPADVVIELLPDLPSQAQADLVAGLWEVRHPAVTDLLTALSDHHPDPDVARAARKAAFKARSPVSRARRRRTEGPWAP